MDEGSLKKVTWYYIHKYYVDERESRVLYSDICILDGRYPDGWEE